MMHQVVEELRLHVSILLEERFIFKFLKIVGLEMFKCQFAYYRFRTICVALGLGGSD